MTLDGVCSILTLHGPRAAADATPSLLVEVPHGADTDAHYAAIARQLVGPLPAGLERFFHVNTDVGAWDLGLLIAQRWLERHPTAVAVAIRCHIPRTFIDTNRIIGAEPAGLTPGLAPYIRDPADQALLLSLHRRYTEVVSAALDRVCAAGGLALIPHTYAPRTVPIHTIDDHIVDALTAAYQPGVIEHAPLRPAVDLITHTPEGVDLSPPGLADRVTAALAAIDIRAERDQSYSLHPSTAGAQWAMRYPGQVFSFEVRRDLVTVWEPFVAKALRMERIERIAGVVAGCL